MSSAGEHVSPDSCGVSFIVKKQKTKKVPEEDFSSSFSHGHPDAKLVRG
jgi:hypothetical protein